MGRGAGTIKGAAAGLWPGPDAVVGCKLPRPRPAATAGRADPVFSRFCLDMLLFVEAASMQEAPFVEAQLRQTSAQRARDALGDRARCTASHSDSHTHADRECLPPFLSF